MFIVCGRLDIECLNTLTEQIEAEEAKIVLGLSEVMLAGHEAVTLLQVVTSRVSNSGIAPLFFVGRIFS